MLLFDHLPNELVNEKAEFFFLPLVTMLVGDKAAPCRTAAGVAIRDLLQRVSTKCKTELIDLTLTWYGSDSVDNESDADEPTTADQFDTASQALRNTAAQAMRLCVSDTALGAELELRIARSLLLVLRRYETRLDNVLFAPPEAQSNNDDGAGVGDWSMLYYTLLACEELVSHHTDAGVPALFDVDGPLHGLWKVCCFDIHQDLRILSLFFLI